MEGNSDGSGHNGERKLEYCRETAAKYGEFAASISGQGLLTDRYSQQRFFGTQFSVRQQKEIDNHESV